MAGDIEIPDEVVRVALDAAFPGLPAGMTLDEAERRIRAGLAAAVPLLRAQWEAEHQCVSVVEEGPPEVFFDDHDLAAIGMYEPDEPVADVQAAFDAAEKGVTRRPSCPVDVWDGPYRMTCGLTLVKGECVRHGAQEPRAGCDATYDADPRGTTHDCRWPKGHVGPHNCRCGGLGSYTWPTGEAGDDRAAP